MNNSELETLIRNILREQLVPATPRTLRNAIFQTVDEAVCAAHQAFLRFQQCPLKTRSAIISAIREELMPRLTELAEESAKETGMGNKEDKYLKNKAALDNTPGIEDLTTTALTGDGGMVLLNTPRLGLLARSRQAPTPRKPSLTTASACWRRATACWQNPRNKLR